MSAELKKMSPQEVTGGSKIELRTSSGTVICLNFSEKDQVLPKIVRLVDPDTDHAVVFRSEDGVYHELDSDSASNLQELQHMNHCLHCNCNDGNEQSSNTNADVRKVDERVDKQREKLQKKLRERKASNKEDENCNGHCHQVIQLPIQGLKQYVRVNSSQMNGEHKTSPSKDDSSLESEPVKGKNMLEELKIHKEPDIEVLNSTTVKVSWAGQVSNNSHLDGCSFDLQMFSKASPYSSIYSGSDKEFIVKELKPGMQYKFRLQAEKDDDKGEISPEAICDMPCSVPSTPVQPHIGNRTKTSFTIKWTAPSDNGSPITLYRLEWSKGEKGGAYTECYCGPQRQFKLTHKLPPATPCSFRLQAVNSIGASKFSKDLKCVTIAGAPSVPAPPKLDKAGVNSLNLSWSKPESKGAEISEYLLEMEDDSTGYGFRVVYRGLENSCVIDKLQRNTCYKFRLLASNPQGKSKWSETVMFDTCPERPGQPSWPVLEGKVRSSGFAITWGPPLDMGGSEISAYMLQVDDGKGGQFTEVYRGLECEYTFTGLSPGHLFRIRLAAVSDGGTSEWSKVTKIRTLPVVPGQANPPVLSKSNKPQPNTLDLRWDPPSYDGGAVILGYIMEMVNPGTKEFREIHHLADNMCTVAGLLPGRTYSFRVKAKNEAGVGKVSEVSHITTAPGPPDTPRAPDTLCRSAAAIIVSWECPAENGTPVTGYTLEWMEDGAFTELYSGPDKTCEVRKGVSPASFYYFRVKAVSAVGSSLWSPVSTCQTPAASPLAVTSIKVVQKSSSHVSLRWRHPGNNGATITSYNVEVAGFKNISFDVTSEGSEAEEETTSPYQDYDINELQPNTVYRIRVQAVNKIGCGPFSATVFASTGDLPPPAPLLELATPSYQSLKLRWTSRGTGGKTGTAGMTYKLEMLDKNGSFVTVFSGPTTSHKVGKLLERTEYQFRIQACNDAGPGSFSDVVSFVTTAQPPNTVKGLMVENVTPSSLNVRWEPVQIVKRGETIEYLLQSQCVGKDPDFVQAYMGPNTKFEYTSVSGSTEVRFRVCALRLMNAPDQSPSPIKGVFSAVSSARTMTPKKKKILESSAENDDRKPEIKEATRVVLTDKQWAMIFFSGFSLLAVVVILLLPSLFGVSD
ncbi:fibronectin type-III domain-containing protein 3A-like [Stylophora pistillata]|uniref:fibronectin type-III domain-containing protein 3A-like n=1 Tax=Stylophora pistillata TaxID=50429 RepID=UPI000C03A463|nr:fibronectin type-III domain-containing protein 3A-like [Stylophora pistillata]